jgi:hypothetical protein
MRRTGIVLLVVLSLLAAGCGGQSPVVERIVAGERPSADASGAPRPSASPPAEAREGRRLTPEQARSALPDEAELPGTGWEAPPSTDDNAPPTKPAECIQVGRRGPATQRAEPEVLESVTYRTKERTALDAKFFIASWPDAADGFDVDRAAALVSRCRTFTANGGGKDFPVTVERLTAPPIGEKQFAVRLTVVGDADLTIFWARVGHNMVQLSIIHQTAADQLTPFRPVLESIVKDLAAA